MDFQEKEIVQKIRKEYEEHKASKLDELKEIDKKAKRGPQIFAFTFGIIGSLVFGLGMCLAMKVIGNVMILGIVIGLIGIAMVSVNYFIYRKFMQNNRKKYSSKIFELSDELLNKNEEDK